MNLDQCFSLPKNWYSPDRREESWQRFSLDATKKIFHDLGLTGEYWNLRA